MHFIFIFIIFLFSKNIFGINPCSPKTFNGADSQACVCNATYCDDIPPIPQLNESQVAVYMSSKSGKRYELTTTSFSSDSGQDAIKLTVDPTHTYQKILGFGGAFTGSATHEIFRLDPKAQENLLNSYFGLNGIGYTLGRVPIGSSDFSMTEFSYDNVSNDFDLMHFALNEEDTKYKLPAIQKTMNLTQNKLKLFGSPWSAPAWMKTDHNMTYSASEGGSLLGNVSDPNDKYHQTWAKYFVKFYEAYKNASIDFWGTTIQNEPLNKPAFQSMYMTAEEQRDFIKYFFGPALKSNSVTKDLKIMIWDFNRSNARDFVDTVLQDSNASSYVDGVAMHWYDDFGWFGTRYYSQVLEDIHINHPDKWILNTEACTIYLPVLNEHQAAIGNWVHADFYARDIIDSLNHWSTGWVDWNMVLNSTGGPIWLPKANIDDAPIIVSDDGTEFYKQPMFYVLGHFSKFLVPNSIRINMDFNQTADSQLQGVSFLTHTNQTVTVLYNYDSEKSLNVSLQVKNINSWVNVELEPKSIATIIWNKKGLSNTQSSGHASQVSVNILLSVCLLGFLLV